jgi:hypothetical protein
MKRLVLCAVAALLAYGAMISKPAYACTTDPICVSEGCPNGKTCSFCTGRCF